MQSKNTANPNKPILDFVFRSHPDQPGRFAKSNPELDRFIQQIFGLVSCFYEIATGFADEHRVAQKVKTLLTFLENSKNPENNSISIIPKDLEDDTLSFWILLLKKNRISIFLGSVSSYLLRFVDYDAVYLVFDENDLLTLDNFVERSRTKPLAFLNNLFYDLPITSGTTAQILSYINSEKIKYLSEEMQDRIWNLIHNHNENALLGLEPFTWLLSDVQGWERHQALGWCEFLTSESKAKSSSLSTNQ